MCWGQTDHWHTQTVEGMVTLPPFDPMPKFSHICLLWIIYEYPEPNKDVLFVFFGSFCSFLCLSLSVVALINSRLADIYYAFRAGLWITKRLIDFIFFLSPFSFFTLFFSRISFILWYIYTLLLSLSFLILLLVINEMSSISE